MEQSLGDNLAGDVKLDSEVQNPGDNRAGDVILDSEVQRLLPLLLSERRKSYRRFFKGAIKAIEDLSDSREPELSCFREFWDVRKFWDDDLDLGSKKHSLATLIIKLICGALAEDKLDLGGLIHPSFVKAACSLICSGSADMQMARFEFASVLRSIHTISNLPHVDLIESIITLLRPDDAVDRNATYDSAIGCCLAEAYASCSDATVQQTAESLVSVFPHSLRRTECEELKASLCGAYARIVRCCPPTIWSIRSLLELLDLPELRFHLIDCFKAVLVALEPDISHTSAASDKTVPGQERHFKDESIHTSKRQRVCPVDIADADERPPRLREHIEEVLKNAEYLSGSHSLMRKDRVKEIILRMKHDSPYVRLLLTCELRTFLHRCEDAGEFISDMEIWSSLITCLLHGCAEESGTTVGHRLQLACAECLGSIGAIDPANTVWSGNGSTVPLSTHRNVSNLNLAEASEASFGCRDYARSFMYMESHVREKSGSFNPAAEKSTYIFKNADVSSLMRIYSCLDEPDGLWGFASLSKSLSSQDQLLIDKKSGNWAAVLNACEQAIQVEPKSVEGNSDFLNCLLNKGQHQTMVTYVDGLISRVPEYKKTWCTQGVQAAWRLGDWDLMDKYLSGADEEGGLPFSSSDSNASFERDVAKILQAMKEPKNQSSVAERIKISKQALIAPLAVAGMDSYTRAYPFVVKLHLLRELEQFQELLSGDSYLEKSFSSSDPAFSNAVKIWENRLGFTQSSLWTREPLLAFRRLVFGASGLGAEVGNCWLQYAKLCRLAGHYETAHMAILKAKDYGAPNVHMEKAKLLWITRRDSGSAIAELRQSLLNMPEGVVDSTVMSSINSLLMAPTNPEPTVRNTQSFSDKKDVAKTLLLYSKWIHYSGQKQKEDVLNLYTQVKDLHPCEKGYFHLAKYHEELYVDARKCQQESLVVSSASSKKASVLSNSSTEKAGWDYHLFWGMYFYAKGLHMGHKNLFQALPRLLKLWFDFGTIYQMSGSARQAELNSTRKKIMSLMRGCLKDLPTYQWLTVLPQLVSTICHEDKETVKVVKDIITSVLHQFPQQGLWNMAAVLKSTVPARREAAAEIIQGARKGFKEGDGGHNLLFEFERLTDQLSKLCFHRGQPGSKIINIATEFSALKRMMPLDIIMPIQQSLTVSLPAFDMNNNERQHSASVFSDSDLPTISGIANEAQILSSLQRPKKIILLGNDGIEYPFLCKPKDDLRKDARMMDLFTMINRLLSKYPESRRRKLHIRTFAVVPLTEASGMVEWVPQTSTLREILEDTYSSLGMFDRLKTYDEIKDIYSRCAAGKETEMLKTKILPLFPPVLHKCFLTRFAEPAAWFRSRLAYTTTTAVMSMVGHIVGLGDRHGRNILIDISSGSIVHVDFSCLFDKGLLLPTPELVPFRLTQNMIDGMGITGYEGIFMRVSEITLTVLSTHRETLMSILETFIHDPLVEWTQSQKLSSVKVQNLQAQSAISRVESRLRGVSLPRLVAEAVSLDNLSKMFIGWMSWY